MRLLPRMFLDQWSILLWHDALLVTEVVAFGCCYTGRVMRMVSCMQAGSQKDASGLGSMAQLIAMGMYDT